MKFNVRTAFGRHDESLARRHLRRIRCGGGGRCRSCPLVLPAHVWSPSSLPQATFLPSGSKRLSWANIILESSVSRASCNLSFPSFIVSNLHAFSSSHLTHASSFNKLSSPSQFATYCSPSPGPNPFSLLHIQHELVYLSSFFSSFAEKMAAVGDGVLDNDIYNDRPDGEQEWRTATARAREMKYGRRRRTVDLMDLSIWWNLGWVRRGGQQGQIGSIWWGRLFHDFLTSHWTSRPPGCIGAI